MDAPTVLGWAGTTMQVCGALWLASRPRVPAWAYLAMTPGALLWMGLGLYQGKPELWVLFAVFAAINVWGIWRWRRQ